MSLAHCILLLPLLFLSQLVLYSAGESQQHQLCSQFLCGELGNISYPFFRIGHPRCGVIAMNCTDEPQAQFHEKGKWYRVKYINTLSRRVEIHDPIVEDQLASNSCDLLKTFTEQAYLESFTEETSPFVSFNIKETHPFFKCKLKPNYFSSYSNKFARHSCKDDDLKFFHQFDKYCCNDYCFYSKNQEKVLPSLPNNLSHYCSVVFLTCHKEHEDESGGLKYNPMWQGAPFIIDWKILPACLNCFVNGGDCLGQNGGFKCSKNNIDGQKGSKKGVKVLIGLGAGLGCILLTCIVFVVHKRLKRKRSSSSSALISRDLSRDSSLKPDPEKGGLFFETKLFTYKELDEATNHFDSSKELGDGGFGTVYHGKLRDGRVVAVKRLYEHNYKRVEQFMNEIEILSRLRHQNLVSLYGCTSRHSRELLLVYEFVPNGTVADHLHGERVEEGLLTWPIRMSIAIQSADALAYLHASEIIHRDVKSNNILLDDSFHVKVADFGLSRLFPINVTHVSTAPQGTPGYVDPEYYQCYQLTNKSDVYSFGVVLIELISSKPAVDIGRHRHEINLANMAVNRIHNQALHELVDPSLGYDTDYSVRNMITLVAELAFRCLQQENEMRPCMTEVLEILRSIEKEEYKKIKTDDMDTSAVARLLKTSEPLSPDTVTGKWPSKNTTPNTSG